LAAFAGLYVAQGIPWGLFMVALPTWLAAQGRTSTEIGLFLATVSIPWTLKLFAGPVMDRFSYPAMGRRRPWVLGAQTGIFLGCLLMAVGGTAFAWLLFVGFLVNACAALQDVAVDGMAIDVLPESERARANAFMFGGQIAGISGTSAGGAWLLSSFGLASAAMVMALSVGLIALIPLFFREREGEKLLPWTEGSAQPRSIALQEKRWRVIFGDLVRVLVLPMSLLLIVIKFGDRVVVGILNAAFPLLTTQELGYDSTFYPEWNAASGLVAAGFGILIAPFIDRIGAQRALFWGLALKAGVILAAGMLAAFWTDPDVLVAVIFAIGLVGQLLTIASISLFMSLCAPRVAASQFAIYMAMSNLALSSGSALIGPLDNLLDYDQIFFVVAAVDVFMLGLMGLFDLDRHRSDLELHVSVGGTNATERET
jgi:PAT family beta-lactamase induction signal transducer AmpG